MWCSTQAALGRRKFEKSFARHNPQGMKAGHHQNLRRNNSSQFDIAVAFTRLITNVTGRSHQNRRHGSMPTSYSG
jgi:hypothetical protein